MLCLFQRAALPEVNVARNRHRWVVGKDSVVAVINDLTWTVAIASPCIVSWTSPSVTEMRGVEEYTLR